MDKNIQKLLLALQKEELFKARFELQSKARSDDEYEKLHKKVETIKKRIAHLKIGDLTEKEILEELLKQMDIANMDQIEFKDDAEKLKQIKKKKKTLKKLIEQTIIEISKTENITERGIKL